MSLIRPLGFALIALIALTALAVSAAGSQLRADRILSADTDVVVEVRDIQAFQENFKASPWADLLQALPDSLSYKAEKARLKISDLVSGLTGPVVLAVDLDDLTLEDLTTPGHGDPRVAILAGSANEEAFRFLAKRNGMGDPDKVDAILRSMQHPNRSIWDRSDVKPQLGKFTKDTSSIAVSDAGWVFRRVYHARASEQEEYIDQEVWESLGRKLGLAIDVATKTPAGVFRTLWFVHRGR